MHTCRATHAGQTAGACSGRGAGLRPRQCSSAAAVPGKRRAVTEEWAGQTSLGQPTHTHTDIQTYRQTDRFPHPSEGPEHSQLQHVYPVSRSVNISVQCLPPCFLCLPAGPFAPLQCLGQVCHQVAAPAPSSATEATAWDAGQGVELACTNWALARPVAGAALSYGSCCMQGKVGGRRTSDHLLLAGMTVSRVSCCSGEVQFEGGPRSTVRSTMRSTVSAGRTAAAAPPRGWA